MEKLKELEAKTEEELHNMTILAYQNTINLSPALKELAVNAKSYFRSLQNAQQAASLFYDSLAKVSQMALLSKGTAHSLGDTIGDVVAVNRKMEARKLEVINYLQRDLITPLEQLVESNLPSIKSLQKSYSQENKIKMELVDKAKGELLKVRKKSQRKKPTEKYEEKERQCEQQVQSSQNELHEFRLTSCRKALSEEKKRYCFVLDRTNIFAKSTMESFEYNSQILSQKLPVWLSFVKRNGDQESGVNGSIMNLGNEKLETNDRIKLMAKFAHSAVEPSQLSFGEGDIIHPVSEVVSGWQYGENSKTSKCGWFPAAYMEQVLAVPTGSTVSQTLPAGGVHSRPALENNMGHRLLRRPVSDGSESPQLPPTDYESLNKGDNEQAATSNISSPFGRDPFNAQSPSKKAGLSSTPMCPPPPPPPLPQTLPRIKEVAPDHSDFSETESNGLVSNL